MRLINRMSVALAGAAMVAGAVALHAATTRTDRPTQAITASAYELDDSLAAMVAFPTNTDIVAARVTRVGEARWNTLDGRAPAARSAATYIYTPVSVVVERVYRGSAQRVAETLTVRRYGGEVDGTTFAIEGTSTALLTAGRDVVLFLQSPHPLSDRTNQRIANMVFAVGEDGTLTNVDGLGRGTTAALESLVR